MNRFDDYPLAYEDVPASQIYMGKDVTKYGMIKKKSGGMKFPLRDKYDERFVIIHKGWVYYYKSKTSMKPQNKFSLQNFCPRVNAAEEETTMQPFVFKLYPKKKKESTRTWYFAAENQQEMNEWMEAFKSEIQKFDLTPDSNNLRSSRSVPTNQITKPSHPENNNRSQSVNNGHVQMLPMTTPNMSVSSIITDSTGYGSLPDSDYEPVDEESSEEWDDDGDYENQNSANEEQHHVSSPKLNKHAPTPLSPKMRTGRGLAPVSSKLPLYAPQGRERFPSQPVIPKSTISYPKVHHKEGGHHPPDYKRRSAPPVIQELTRKQYQRANSESEVAPPPFRYSAFVGPQCSPRLPADKHSSNAKFTEVHKNLSLSLTLQPPGGHQPRGFSSVGHKPRLPEPQGSSSHYPATNPDRQRRKSPSSSESPPPPLPPKPNERNQFAMQHGSGPLQGRSSDSILSQPLPSPPGMLPSSPKSRPYAGKPLPPLPEHNNHRGHADLPSVPPPAPPALKPRNMPGGPNFRDPGGFHGSSPKHTDFQTPVPKTEQYYMQNYDNNTNEVAYDDTVVDDMYDLPDSCTGSCDNDETTEAMYEMEMTNPPRNLGAKPPPPQHHYKINSASPQFPQNRPAWSTKAIMPFPAESKIRSPTSPAKVMVSEPNSSPPNLSFGPNMLRKTGVNAKSPVATKTAVSGTKNIEEDNTDKPVLQQPWLRNPNDGWRGKGSDSSLAKGPQADKHASSKPDIINKHPWQRKNPATPSPVPQNTPNQSQMAPETPATKPPWVGGIKNLKPTTLNKEEVTSVKALNPHTSMNQSNPSVPQKPGFTKPKPNLKPPTASKPPIVKSPLSHNMPSSVQGNVNQPRQYGQQKNTPPTPPVKPKPSTPGRISSPPPQNTTSSKFDQIRNRFGS